MISLITKIRVRNFLHGFSGYSSDIFVGNDAERRTTKWMLQEIKARQVFRKTNISYPLVRTCISGGEKCSIPITSELFPITSLRKVSKS